MNAGRDRDSPVVVARFTRLIDAELARTVLEGAGLDCGLQNDHVVGVLPHLADAMGGVELRVAARDLETARALLAETDGSEADPDPRIQPGEELPPCDDVPMQPSPRDAHATRAFRAAVLGLFLVPALLNLYSLYLLATLGRHDGSLSARGKRHLILAALLNLGVFGFWFVVLHRRRW